VLEERDERRGDGDELLGRDVHVVDVARLDERQVTTLAAQHQIFDERPSGLILALACAMIASSSRLASSHTISVVTRPSFTVRYGVSMKPRSFTRAKQASDVMRPMFGPSGVSIGHMRPYCE
jgi:hypothetical protein